MSMDKKRQFVELTYEILKNEGPEGVKIRRVAKEMNCTSTVIYRYFEDVDHLIALSSVEFLKGYIVEFSKMSAEALTIQDPYTVNLHMWERLAEYAFNNMDIFEPMFFGKYKDNLGELIYEYYQIFFEEEKQNFDGFSASILFNSDMVERDTVLLRRAASMGILKPEHPEVIARAEVYLFHGVLRRYMGESKNPKVIRKAKTEFMQLLTTMSEQFRISPGKES